MPSAGQTSTDPSPPTPTLTLSLNLLPLQARKKKEAQKLAVQNDAYEKKMENVVSKTDCSYDATPMS